MISKIIGGILVFMILVFQYNVWLGDRGKQKIARLNTKIDQQLHQNELSTLQNEELEKQIHSLRTKPEVLEEKAREILGLVKKGEVFYRIIPSERH